MKRLVLFDIDGTLLLCGRQVGPIFIDALRAVFGEFRRPEGYSFAGKTDPMIVRDMVHALGLSDEIVESGLPRMHDLYVEDLERRLDAEQMRLLPGVVELLDRLAARDDVLVGLLTGNWRRGAEVKLSRFGLGRYFALGAFGDDGRIRRDLVPVALDRAARQRGRRFEPHEVLIVGDTVLDVDCARAAGVPCMAVATGFTPARDLEAAGADHVYDDLREAARDHGWFR